MATSVAECLVTVAAIVFARRYTSVKLISRRNRHYYAATLLMVILLYVLKVLITDEILYAFTGVLCSILLYGGYLWFKKDALSFNSGIQYSIGLIRIKMSRYDYLIVGAGLYGSMFAYKARKAGKKVLVIDKRPHAGGNLYCENIEGINVHKYGPHIFHTSNKEVWDFVNSIVPFNHFRLEPLASYKGQLYNLPFNMNTFHQLWGVNTPEEAKAIIDKQRKEFEGKEPQNLEEQAISLVGRDVYETLIKGYTEKQWGRKCTDLPSFIIRRLPVRFCYNNNYFNDCYQGIPVGGYNKLVDGLLEGADIRLDVDFLRIGKL